MKHHFQINKDKNIITETFEGEVTLADLNIANQRLLNHPDFNKGLNSITDFRSAKLNLDYNGMFSYIYTHPDFELNKLAVIANKDNDFELARMFGILSEHKSIWKELKVFINKEEVEKWLTL